MILSPIQIEQHLATAVTWLLAFLLGCIVSGLIMLAILDSNPTQANPPGPEQVRGRAPGLSDEGVFIRQTEARAERTLDPPRIQKPPGWGVGNAFLPAPLPTGEVGL